MQLFMNLINVASTFIFVYPLYGTIFRSLQSVHQFAFIFVLPVIKVGLKKLTQSRESRQRPRAVRGHDRRPLQRIVLS
uniref:Uncharacterized protein n=1 Tax=Globisporangium ultimum (strain ATCC 200006 / CBS 805.95 / DAOM BR144) TaxID=431595 RepID=K3WJH8_GLOUD